MTEKGCDNCYYTYFDERAYPCSLCIRGIERTDQWQPSRKTKAEQTEPQQVVRLKHFKCPKCGRSDYIRSFEDWDIDGGIYKYKCINCNTYIKDEPNCSEKPNNCKDFFREPTAEERKAVADYIDSISVPTGVNIFDLMDEPQTDCAWK